MVTVKLGATFRDVLAPNARKLLASERLSRLISAAFGADIPSRGLRFSVDNPAVGTETAAELFFRLYERHEVALIRTVMLTDCDVVELGAGIGVTGSHVLARLDNGRRLISVEANEAVLPTLRLNLDRHRRGHEIILVHGGVSYGAESVVSLHQDDHHTYSRVVDRLPGSVEAAVTPVPALTLNGLVDRFQLRDYVVISDIEGAELDIINGDSSALMSCRQIIVELHGSEPEISAMVSRLTDLGFIVTEQRKHIFAFTKSLR